LLEERLKAAGIHPLCFWLRAEEDLRLPEYKGALFRGGFGAYFRAAVCRTGAEKCAGCAELASCPYSLVFETPVAPERFALLRKYPHAPHPFVMTPPVDSRREIPRGEEFVIDITLIGPGVEHLPHFIGAIAAMGRGGKYGGRFRIARVDCASGLVFDGKTGRLEGKPAAWLPGERGRARRATLHFVTPLSLRWKGEYQEAPDFRAVAHGLLGRIHVLSAL